MKESGLAQTLPPLLAGLLIPIYMQTITGWWLNSGRGVAYTDGSLLALAVIFGIVGAGSPGSAAGGVVDRSASGLDVLPVPTRGW